jgi:hypothetical protein
MSEAFVGYESVELLEAAAPPAARFYVGPQVVCRVVGHLPGYGERAWYVWAARVAADRVVHYCRLAVGRVGTFHGRPIGGLELAAATADANVERVAGFVLTWLAGGRGRYPRDVTRALIACPRDYELLDGAAGFVAYDAGGGAAWAPAGVGREDQASAPAATASEGHIPYEDDTMNFTGESIHAAAAARADDGGRAGE